MSLVPVKLPFDDTGNALSNKVTSEPHVLNASTYRVFVPQYGAFYSDSVVVRDAASNRTLTKGTDYYTALLATVPTRQTGLEVHQVIVITDQTCGANVLFDGQMVGGEYSYCYDAIIQLLNTLDLDSRPVLFDDIIDKPDGYPPAPHYHDVGDVYGFEFLTEAVERVRQAILLGASPSTKAILDYLDNQLANQAAIITAIQDTYASRAAVWNALGYQAANRGGDQFSGLMTFNKGLLNSGANRKRVVRLNAITATTTLDLSVAPIYVVTLNASTTIQFDTSNIPSPSGASESIEFDVMMVQDATGGWALAFGPSVKWSNHSMPNPGTTANLTCVYRFTSYDGGATFVGALRDPNIG